MDAIEEVWSDFKTNVYHTNNHEIKLNIMSHANIKKKMEANNPPTVCLLAHCKFFSSVVS